MGATGGSARSVEIRIEDLHKAFDDVEVLRGVDLEIFRGELVTVVGASGCGKTVLLQHVIAHLKPDRGRVLVSDHDLPGSPLVDLASLDELALDRIRVHTAIVFQRNALFSDTVYENIAVWLREILRLDEEAILERARHALDAVGLGRERGILTRHRDELSGGMAKRVAVARALAMRPMVIFLDEPTTGLDPTSAYQIHDLIEVTHRRPVGGEIEPTTVIITHDKDLLRRLRPRVVMLHDGQVHFDGPFEEFEASRSPIIRPYFELMPVLHDRVRSAI
jgi:phospholipid/cholesterol/gamma-HCH transport system ATP-binding protein